MPRSVQLERSRWGFSTPSMSLFLSRVNKGQKERYVSNCWWRNRSLKLKRRHGKCAWVVCEKKDGWMKAIPQLQALDVRPTLSSDLIDGAFFLCHVLFGHWFLGETREQIGPDVTLVYRKCFGRRLAPYVSCFLACDRHFHSIDLVTTNELSRFSAETEWF